jgi:replicative DNA helicase
VIPERFAAALDRNEEIHPATRKVESALIGAALTVGQMPKEPPRPEDFSSEAHRVTWAAVLAIAARGETPDLSLLQYELAKTGELGRAGGQLGLAGGPAVLAAHLDSTDCSDLDVYARIVKEAARMRQLTRLKG